MKTRFAISASIIVLALFFWADCRSGDESGPGPEAEKTSEEAVSAPESSRSAELTPLEELGKKIFFDARLSTPEGQSCAICHGLEAGFTGPIERFNFPGAVYEGALAGRFGNRKPPASAYVGDSPNLHIDEDGNFVGGLFWDGRATGEILGDPLAEQAMGPFLNPLEMNEPDKASVVNKIKDMEYAALFEEVWGEDSLDAEKDLEGSYERIARSLAAYERSVEVNPFSSKFDDFWRTAAAAGKDVSLIDESNREEYEDMGLDERELKGLMLFNTKGLCAECHILTSQDGKPPLFTDFTYDNLGVPRNPENPFYAMGREWNPDGAKWIDKGLGGYLETVEAYAGLAAENYGKHKVPTVRNVDRRPEDGFVKVYMHNGFFRSLKDVVHFYNARDKEGEDWPPPEVPENVNVDEMSDLGLTEEEEDLIVLFMATLSDR